MTKILQIGNLRLDMGSVSHAVGFNINNFDTFMKYATDQSVFNKGVSK